MKKLIKSLPLIISLFLLAYSIYAHSRIQGFEIFKLKSSTGMFYVSTYRYAALIGALICLIYIIIFVMKISRRRRVLKHKIRSDNT